MLSHYCYITVVNFFQYLNDLGIRVRTCWRHYTVLALLMKGDTVISVLYTA